MAPPAEPPALNPASSLIPSSPISQLYQIANFGSLTVSVYRVFKYTRKCKFTNEYELFRELKNGESEKKNWKKPKRTPKIQIPKMTRMIQAPIGSKLEQDASEL